MRSVISTLFLMLAFAEGIFTERIRLSLALYTTQKVVKEILHNKTGIGVKHKPILIIADAAPTRQAVTKGPVLVFSHFFFSALWMLL